MSRPEGAAFPWSLDIFEAAPECVTTEVVGPARGQQHGRRFVPEWWPLPMAFLYTPAFLAARSGRQSAAQGGAGFAEPWVRRKRTRARQAGEKQFGACAASVARFAGLLS